MTRIIIMIAILLNSHLISGCIFNSDSPELKDAGTYTLKADKSTLQSGRNGGGLFIISMETSEDFQGKVQLTIDFNPNLNAELTTSVLSLDKLVTELMIRPDSLIALGDYTIKVISEHGGVKDEIELYVEIVQSIPEDFNPPYQKYIEFVQWVESEYSIIVFEEGEELFSFFEYPIRDGGSTFYFLSSTLETKITQIVIPSGLTYYYLRKRGEVTPILAAKKGENTDFIEIPVSDLI